MSSFLENRADFCLSKLGCLRESLQALEEYPDSKVYSVYVVGSYARDEATDFSDLDAFLVAMPDEGQKVPRVMEARLVAALATAQQDLSLPDFTDGGEFLEVHTKANLVGNLGNSCDDYQNTFTARMLMLLESKPIFNDGVYTQIVKEVVTNYFKDFHEHSENFKPTFLVNDILRFWRTLCLNYEHKREWRVDGFDARAKGHLQNLKLKFSRLLTCFSTISYLLSKAPGVGPKDVREVLQNNPLMRLKLATEAEPSCEDLWPSVEREYEWFLSALNQDADSVRKWIMMEDERIEAFRHAASFGNSVYQIVKCIAEKRDLERFLVI